MDFKVRCLISFSGITKGKIYEIQNGYFCFDDGDKAGPYKNFKELEQHFGSKFELVTDKPHICTRFGVEEGEMFKFEDTGGKYQVCSGHVLFESAGGWKQMQNQELFEYMLEHPEKIIREPQFSEDEKAFMRELAKAGFPIFYRCASDCLRVRKLDSSSWIDLPNSMLPSITEESGDINAAKYLEGLK